MDELGVAAVDIGQELNDLGGLGHVLKGSLTHAARHTLGLAVLEGAEVYIKAEMLGAGTVDELQILVPDMGGVQGGGKMDLVLHANIVLLREGQGLLNVALPAGLGIAHLVQAGDLGAQGGEAQQIGQTEVLLQLLHDLGV